MRNFGSRGLLQYITGIAFKSVTITTNAIFNPEKKTSTTSTQYAKSDESIETDSCIQFMRTGLRNIGGPAGPVASFVTNGFVTLRRRVSRLTSCTIDPAAGPRPRQPAGFPDIRPSTFGAGTLLVIMSYSSKEQSLVRVFSTEVHCTESLVLVQSKALLY